MMTLMELYRIKLYEYKTTGLREKPWKLLAMLLLSEKEKYQPINPSKCDFYDTYQEAIEEKIRQVEVDFHFTKEELMQFIEECSTKFPNYSESQSYEQKKIRFVYREGYGVLSWGLWHYETDTPEQIYNKYFRDNALNKEYNLEQRTVASNITVTPLDDLLDKICNSSAEFYQKICENLTVEERMFLLENLENKSCATCVNESCRVENSEKIGLDEKGRPSGSQCLGWYNSEFIGRSKILKRSDIYKLK